MSFTFFKLVISRLGSTVGPEELFIMTRGNARENQMFHADTANNVCFLLFYF